MQQKSIAFLNYTGSHGHEETTAANDINVVIIIMSVFQSSEPCKAVSSPNEESNKQRV